jgi:hypothetical protein
LVAWWLAASVPLMVAGFLMGLLGSSMAVGIMALCGVLFWGGATENAIGTAADRGASLG